MKSNEAVTTNKMISRSKINMHRNILTTIPLFYLSLSQWGDDTEKNMPYLYFN